MDQGRQDSEGGGDKKKESAGFPSKLKMQMTGNRQNGKREPRQIQAGGKKKKKKSCKKLLCVCACASSKRGFRKTFALVWVDRNYLRRCFRLQLKPCSHYTTLSV